MDSPLYRIIGTWKMHWGNASNEESCMKNLKKSELNKLDNFTLKTMEYNGEKVLVKVYETVNDNINTFKKYGGYNGQGCVR